MNLLTQYRGLRREVYVLFFGRIVTNLGAMVWPLLTLILNQKLGMSASAVAVLMLFSGAVLLPMNLVGGRLADRFDKKRIIVVCDSVSIVFYITLGLVPLSLASLPLMVAAAAFQTMEGPAYDALLADLTLTKDRERAYSLLYLGANLGLVLSPTIAGFLFKRALWLAFIISGLAIGCSTLLIAFQLKDTAPLTETGGEAAYQTDRKGDSLVRVMRDNPAVLLYIAVMALYYTAYQQFGYLMPLDLGRVHGEDGALIFGTVNSLNCLIVILCTPLITHGFRRLWDTRKTLAGLLLQSAGFAVFALALGHIPFYYVSMVLFTWGEVFATVAEGPYLSSRIPASHRGRVNGLISVAISLTTGAGQLVTGRLFDTRGSGAAWAFTLAADTAALGLCLWLILWDRRRYPGLYGKEVRT